MPPEWIPRCRGAVSRLWREVDHRAGHIVVGAAGDPAPRLDLLRPGVLLTGAVPECLGHVTHRGPGPVADDVRHLGGVVPAVLRVHVLDDLFTTVGVEVDVDVGFLVPGGGEEPLERQVVEDRVDGGDVQCIADGRVGR